MKPAERTQLRKSLLYVAAELALYAVFLVGYYFLVLHLLGGWLKDLFDHGRKVYAGIALLLMAGQAVGLELVTSWIVSLFRKGD